MIMRHSFHHSFSRQVTRTNTPGAHPPVSSPCTSVHKRVYMPHREVADTPFHIQGDVLDVVLLDITRLVRFHSVSITD